MNSVNITGRMCEDAELRATESGKSVTTIRIAVNNPINDQADFFSVVVWGKTAESLCKYKRKGDLLGIEGRLQSRVWTDNEEKKHYETEIVADSVEWLDHRKGGEKDEE